MKSKLLSLSLDYIHGVKKATQVIESTLIASRKVNEQFGCVTLSTNEKESMNQASIIDEQRHRGELLPLLSGIPIAIKDNYALKGSITTAGSQYLSTFQSPYDSTVVQSLQASQAIICLKSNMDEFGMGSSMLHSSYGPCINPWSSTTRSLSPGGSSGASAVSVACGLVPGAIGSDTGGSVRLPASFCGVVGFKPTYGLISRHGLISYASSMDTPGIITSSVMDTTILFDSLCHHDDFDPTSSYRQSGYHQCPKLINSLFHVSKLNYQNNLLSCNEKQIYEMIDSEKQIRSLKGITIGYPIEFNVEELDVESRKNMFKSFEILKDAEAIIKPLSIPSLKLALPTYYLLACAEASSNLARYDGIRYGKRAYINLNRSKNDGHHDEAEDERERIATVSDLHQLISKSRGEYLGSEVIKRILSGTFVLSKRSYDEYYGKAMSARQQIKQEIDQIFNNGVDIIMGPTSPILPFPLNHPPDSASMMLNDFYTVIANLTGIPAVTIPVAIINRSIGKDIEYLPMGLQFMGKRFNEETVLKVAHALEQRVDFIPKITNEVKVI